MDMEAIPATKHAKLDCSTPTSRQPLHTIDLSTWSELIASHATLPSLPTPPPFRHPEFLLGRPPKPVGRVTTAEPATLMLQPPLALTDCIPVASNPSSASWHSTTLQQALSAVSTSTGSQTDASVADHAASADVTAICHPLSDEGAYALPELEINLHSNNAAAKEALADVVIHSTASVVVIRDFSHATGLNTRLFDPRRLARRCPEHPIDLRKHRVSLATPERHRSSKGEDTWMFHSQPDSSTLRAYVEYMETWGPDPDDCQTVEVLFGTNLDLDDPKVWQAQLQELRNRIPEPLRWDAPDGLLARLGYTIAGMSGVQLYLKVFGCRTPAHQENNCFASVNLNLGPAPVVWWTVPSTHASTLRRLCAKHNVDFDRDAWWPCHAELRALDIPVRRFVQSAGDFVWVGPGCVHWVQSLGTTTAVSYNVGPPTGLQFEQAWRRYELNLTTRYLSLVPMKRLTLALTTEGGRLLPPRLRLAVAQRLRTVLASELQAFQQLERSNSSCQQPLALLAHDSSEPHWYCHDCEGEAFNLVYLRPAEGGKHQVVCHGCRNTVLKARKLQAGVHWWHRPNYQHSAETLATALKTIGVV